MKLLTDEEYEDLQSQARKRERNRCLQTIEIYKQRCIDPECKDLFTDLIQELHAQP